MSEVFTLSMTALTGETKAENERKYLNNDGLRFDLPERNLLIVGEEDLNVAQLELQDIPPDQFLNVKKSPTLKTKTSL